MADAKLDVHRPSQPALSGQQRDGRIHHAHLGRRWQLFARRGRGCLGAPARTRRFLHRHTPAEAKEVLRGRRGLRRRRLRRCWRAGARPEAVLLNTRCQLLCVAGRAQEPLHGELVVFRDRRHIPADAAAGRLACRVRPATGQAALRRWPRLPVSAMCVSPPRTKAEQPAQLLHQGLSLIHI